MKKYFVEFIGTFFFVLTIVAAVNNGSAGNLAPLAIGSILMVMVYAGGHISGAHYNPAVTVGVLIRGKMDRADVPFYMAAQFFGAAIAAFVGVMLVRCIEAPEIAMHSNEMVCALIAEFLGTFALVWVVLHSATTQSNNGNSFYGLAIGFTVMACAYALGPVSGGAFNPAVALGLIVAGMVNVADAWIYLLGEILGAAAAATAFLYVYDRRD